MHPITQDKRLLELQTPLGKDALIIRTIQGREAISQLYSFEVDCFGSNDTPADFSKIVGQPSVVSVILKDHSHRHFHGIVKAFARGARGDFFTAYRMEIVPTLWFLSQKTQSRIFQQISVPDILKKVLEGIDADFELNGTYEPRDYCVQYRETDFAFASRIMEEEGIYYFFRHREDGQTLVLADTAQSHAELEPISNLFYDADRGGMEEDAIIYSWEKQQVLKPGKVTLWDHSFELPHKPLDAQEVVDDDLQVGEVTHKLKIAGNDKLELYDYPGGYAQRFDGIAPAGGERSGDLQKIYHDNQRTTKLRMQQETVSALQITAITDYLNICPGSKFELGRHYSDNDTYVITASNIAIAQAGSFGATNMPEGPPPEIIFNCIPFKLPFVPQRVTAKPSIYGTQTAVVTGPAGEEIFTDKYGRVKVQFFWDRQGKFNGTSSCWIRVASPWAGKQWGMVHIPRIGQEVIVAFEEGDPDQPIIVGSVYNSDQMPPHELPANKTQSGIKSRSTPGAGSNNLNEIRFEDKIGSEFIFIHGEKDVHFRCKAAYLADIGGTFDETVHQNASIEYKANLSVHTLGDHVDSNEGKLTIHSHADMAIISAAPMGLKAPSIQLKTDALTGRIKDDFFIDAGGKIWLDAPTGIYLTCGSSKIALTPGAIYIKGTMVNINSGDTSASASPADSPAVFKPVAPKSPMKAGETGATANPAGSSHDDPANTHDEKADENKDKTHWIEVELKDDSGAPVVGAPCEITLPNGKKATRSTNKKGLIRVDKIDAGNCNVRWLELDKDAVSQ
jgi:type VI secretion system secreted protein VgrG